ncbi:hypothetical protein EII29_00745 [Leptotrichia sp. OH3620_COT-345]|uniref:hypothetical protein n=1 Tax=Leptotrichia sp. OH3620_COT-345 TaxID=2491048 RepID=UPI000F655B03|nr:hypothetical protein [Leptotrichia sp. OH3620_COT-345]RRD41010.1 hypothetical protein EII29_00745 [Leptotrichia sp. OH3620_COT-345]
MNYSKAETYTKKVLLGITGFVFAGMNIFAGETLTYPKDGKADRALGYQKLENSLGISGSYEGNKVIVNAGPAIERVFGAAQPGKENIEIMKKNTVIIDGGTLATNGRWERENENIPKGGSIYGAGGQATLVTENTVIIKGTSTVEGNVYGGYSHRGSATYNKVIIEGTPKFGTETILFGGRGSRSTALKEDKKTLAPLDVITGNTLEIKTKNVTVNDIKNFEKIIFNLSLEEIGKNDKILTLTNNKGVDLEKPETVGVSKKLNALTEEEKNKIIKEKNKDISLKIDVFLQNKPMKNMKNVKVVLINAKEGLRLSKLPKNINKTEKNYKYQVKFEKDKENLYGIINVTFLK